MTQKRIALTDDDGQPTGRWFDPEKARCWEEGGDHDGSNMISRATGSQWAHEALYRTPGGVWVLNSWSNYQGSTESYCEVTSEDASRWLVRNGLKVPAELADITAEMEV